MKAGVLGSGMVGQAISARLAELGHDVMIGTRDPKVYRDLTANVGRIGACAVERQVMT